MDAPRLTKRARCIVDIVKSSPRVFVALHEVQTKLGVQGSAAIKAAREAEAAGRIGVWEIPARTARAGEFSETWFLFDPGRMSARAAFSSDCAGPGELVSRPDAGLTDLMYVARPAATRKRKPGDHGDAFARFGNDPRYATTGTDLVLVGIGRPQWDPAMEYGRDDDGDIDFGLPIARKACKACLGKTLPGLRCCLACGNASEEAEEYAARQTKCAERQARDNGGRHCHYGVA